MADGIRVRLKESNSHGNAGDEVVISYAIGRDLIKAGKAEYVPEPDPSSF